VVRPRTLLSAILMVCAVDGCAGNAPQLASPMPVPPAVLATPATTATPAASCAAALDLAWLDAAHDVSVTEVSDGHFGLWEFHADLRRADDVFIGVVVGTYRRRHGAPVHTSSGEIGLRVEDLVATLTVFRDAARAPPRTPSARDPLIAIEDTSRSTSYTIMASTHGARHVEVYANRAEVEPTLWRVRGCDRSFGWDPDKRVAIAFAKLLGRLGRDALFDVTTAESQRDPR
jgi:hypothetical protein